MFTKIFKVKIYGRKNTGISSFLEELDFEFNKSDFKTIGYKNIRYCSEPLIQRWLNNNCHFSVKYTIDYTTFKRDGIKYAIPNRIYIPIDSENVDIKSTIDPYLSIFYQNPFFK
jgi:hypothetical protein